MPKMVGADRDPGLLGECRETSKLVATDNLVRDEDISDTTVDHRFRFAHLLTTDPNRTQRDLAKRDHGRFVGLGVRAETDAGAGDGGRHSLEILFECIEVNKKTRSVDLL